MQQGFQSELSAQIAIIDICIPLLDLAQAYNFLSPFYLNSFPCYTCICAIAGLIVRFHPTCISAVNSMKLYKSSPSCYGTLATTTYTPKSTNTLRNLSLHCQEISMYVHSDRIRCCLQSHPIKHGVCLRTSWDMA